MEPSRRRHHRKAFETFESSPFPYLDAFHLAGLRLGFALHMLFIDTIFRENLFLENFYSLPACLSSLQSAWHEWKTRKRLVISLRYLIYAYMLMVSHKSSAKWYLFSINVSRVNTEGVFRRILFVFITLRRLLLSFCLAVRFFAVSFNEAQEYFRVAEGWGRDEDEILLWFRHQEVMRWNWNFAYLA